MEYWSDGLSLVNSMHMRISMAFVQGWRRSVLGFRFSNTPLLQYSISMLSRAESWRAPLPGGKPKPGPLGLDSLLNSRMATNRGKKKQ